MQELECGHPSCGNADGNDIFALNISGLSVAPKGSASPSPGLPCAVIKTEIKND
ncbi:hypothetical protein JF546_02800 [Nitratireductor aquimarinus]|uniref:Uncharacterized protein n=1 Tax=Nitratireductor aquimarinus TaxID=889300 RepID=A0ABU4AJT3_9HYPH|nr:MULTISPECIES: hypothetical protein [Alphaproteobacteria]MBY6020775.1 hypothetical protein [Nitratireductor sp. DP7N14-4]MBN7755989.1 hypothetical protein [Nitratireductor aquimarinus]MBN7777710.1 hypothetical protein [Nitratireductor pacificus]MBN7781704.1 hypothetical protein [Nitratireductor pacificus]MBN7790510.1 hypothetical protein [Nitratireductor aquimarinus]